jgi:hypothetical protein
MQNAQCWPALEEGYDDKFLRANKLINIIRYTTMHKNVGIQVAADFHTHHGRLINMEMIGHPNPLFEIVAPSYRMQTFGCM